MFHHIVLLLQSFVASMLFWPKHFLYQYSPAFTHVYIVYLQGIYMYDMLSESSFQVFFILDTEFRFSREKFWGIVKELHCPYYMFETQTNIFLESQPSRTCFVQCRHSTYLCICDWKDMYFAIKVFWCRLSIKGFLWEGLGYIYIFEMFFTLIKEIKAVIQLFYHSWKFVVIKLHDNGKRRKTYY